MPAQHQCRSSNEQMTTKPQCPVLELESVGNFYGLNGPLSFRRKVFPLVVLLFLGFKSDKDIEVTQPVPVRLPRHQPKLQETISTRFHVDKFEDL